jgi:hypothetical protein
MASAGLRSFLGFWVGGGGQPLFSVIAPTPASYPRLADSDRFLLYAIPELTFGVQPGLSAVVRDIPVVSMKGGIQTVRRAGTLYNAFNQRSASVAVSRSTSAHIEFELRSDAYEAFCASLIGAIIFDPQGLQGFYGVYVDAVARSFVVMDDIDWLSLGVKAGMWVYTAGFYYPTNNDVFLIESVTKNTLVVHGMLTSESPASTHSGYLKVGFRFGHARAGQTQTTFFFEGQYTDVALFEQYGGMHPSSMSLEMRPQSLIHGSMDFIGQKANTSTVSVLNPAYLCHAKTKTYFDTSNSVLAVWEGGTSLTVPITGFSLQIDNNTDPLTRLSSLDAYSLHVGPLDIRGTLQVYFATLALKNTVLSAPTTSLHVHLASSGGDRWILSFPSVTILGAETSVEGRARDVFVTAQWEATFDPVLECAMTIDFFQGSTFTYIPFATNAPPAEYFRMRDQADVVWYFWFSAAGELARDQAPPVLRDETAISITTGTVPSWHVITDEAAGTWYVYPNLIGELVISNTAPSIGTGLTVGLGQQARGIDHAVYRLGARSRQTLVTQTMDITWQGVPRAWYLWLNQANLPVIDRLPPNYVPGMIGTSSIPGPMPAFYAVRDAPTGILYYMYISPPGVLTLNQALPPGVGYISEGGIPLISLTRLSYLLTVYNTLVTYQLTSSVCGV